MYNQIISDVLNPDNWNYHRGFKSKYLVVYSKKNSEFPDEIYFLPDDSFIFYGDYRISYLDKKNVERFNLYKKLLSSKNIHDNYNKRKDNRLIYYFDSLVQASFALKAKLKSIAFSNSIFEEKDFPSFEGLK